MRPLSRSSKEEMAVEKDLEAIRPRRESARCWTGPAQCGPGTTVFEHWMNAARHWTFSGLGTPSWAPGVKKREEERRLLRKRREEPPVWR